MTLWLPTCPPIGVAPASHPLNPNIVPTWSPLGSNVVPVPAWYTRCSQSVPDWIPPTIYTWLTPLRWGPRGNQVEPSGNMVGTAEWVTGCDNLVTRQEPGVNQVGTRWGPSGNQVRREPGVNQEGTRWESHILPAWADVFLTWCVLGPHLFPTWMPLWSPLVSRVGSGNRVVIRRGVNQVGARWEWTRWEQGGDERVRGRHVMFLTGPPLGPHFVYTWSQCGSDLVLPFVPRLVPACIAPFGRREGLWLGPGRQL